MQRTFLQSRSAIQRCANRTVQPRRVALRAQQQVRSSTKHTFQRVIASELSTLRMINFTTETNLIRGWDDNVDNDDDGG